MMRQLQILLRCFDFTTSLHPDSKSRQAVTTIWLEVLSAVSRPLFARPPSELAWACSQPMGWACTEIAGSHRK